MEALEEQMQIVRGHWGEGRFDFDGEHYSARELDARPKPVQRPLPLILGAKGGPRTLRMAARWADEYNTVMSTAEEIADLASASTWPAKRRAATRRACRSR